ncbi:MAG TPA: DUF1993 domain-containing protein, partial [Rubrivivax sp.]|nr:DUF1993 domain-containing protein [Rubrivivax sp.]
MSLSLHSATVPTFVRGFNNLLSWLDKAQAHAEARKFDSQAYLTLKLAPDMLPFTRQVQIASDGAKACVARLAGVDVPAWEDNEASFDDLRARVRKTIDYLQSVPAEQVNAGAEREIVLPQRTREPLRLTAENFVFQYALPNFYFHTATTYALLRQAGV